MRQNPGGEDCQQREQIGRCCGTDTDWRSSLGVARIMGDSDNYQGINRYGGKAGECSPTTFDNILRLPLQSTGRQVAASVRRRRTGVPLPVFFWEYADPRRCQFQLHRRTKLSPTDSAGDPARDCRM